MYHKAEPLRQRLDPTYAESLADALSEIGNDLMQKNDFPMAVKWLKRAYEFLNSKDLEKLSRDGIELRLTLGQNLVRALLGLNTAESLEEAQSQVDGIEAELGGKLIVLLLRLEILLRSPADVFDSGAFADVLRRVMKASELSEQSYKITIHHIRKLDQKSPGLACQILDEFLEHKVVPAQQNDWLERAVVLRTYMSTTHRDAPATVRGLRSIFEIIQANVQKPLGTETALAILTVT
jgi:hypothetical protein